MPSILQWGHILVLISVARLFPRWCKYIYIFTHQGTLQLEAKGERNDAFIETKWPDYMIKCDTSLNLKAAS